MYRWETNIDAGLLGRKMFYFLKEIKRQSDEFHRADSPANDFRTSAQGICAVLDDVVALFKPMVLECMLDNLNNFNKQCEAMVETIPDFNTNLSKQECYRLASLIKPRYVHKKAEWFHEGMVIAQRADEAVDMFCQTIVIISKAMRNGIDIEPVLQKCVDKAKVQELEENPGTVVQLFPARELKK